MEWKYPIVKKDGSEYTADELYEKLAQEDSGYYLLSTNQFWHGGVHFTSKNFAHCIRDFPVQAIAEGTVVAYRINKDYLFIEDEDVIAVPPEKGGYQYSSGFCLIKHNIEFTREITEEEKQQAIQEKVQQTTDKLKNQQITVQGSSRNYRNEEGIKPAKAGNYLEGTKLEIISIGDTPKDNLYFAKVREKGKTATTDEHYIALLDKDGNPLKNKDGGAFFEIPQPPNDPPSADTENRQPAKNNAQPPATNPSQPTTFNLEFYSLYMHLCAYQDYQSGAEDEIHTNITIKATGLPVRNKYRTEQNSQVIGNISTGAILKVLEEKPASDGIVEVKAVIISGTVIKDNVRIKQKDDELIVPVSKKGHSYIEEAESPLLKQRERPSYWQGTVTAKVKKTGGITLWQALEASELKTELGKINQGSQFTFDSTQVKTITHNNQTLLIAECTPEGTFTVSGGHGKQPADTFWTTVDKDSITREQVEPTVFNTVVPCNVKVIAGENLGYLGVYETPDELCEVNKKRQVHVEVFTPNLATVGFLLNNPFKLTGKKYIKLVKNTRLSGQLPAEIPKPVFSTPTFSTEFCPIPDYVTKQDHIFAIDTLKTKKQLNGKEWYQITTEQNTGYIEKQSMEEIDQHEWAKLGFHVVQEANSYADGYLDPKLMPSIFQQIYSKIDTSGDGKLQKSELKAALQDQEIREQWSKLIACHPSEWRTDTRPMMMRFTQLLTNTLAPAEQQARAQKLLAQEVTRMNHLTFLEQVVPPVPPMLYHFHPVTFVEYNQQRNCDNPGCFCNSNVKLDNDFFIIHEKIKNARIVSCNNSGLFKNGVKIIVLHRTNGGAAEGTLNHMSTQGYGAHFVIDNDRGSDGVINQAISLNKRGSHMGVLPFPETKVNGWGNKNSIAIEVCGYSYDIDGKIRVGDSKKNGYGEHHHWENITDKQAQSVACLVKYLIKHFNLKLGDVKCHEELCQKTENEGRDVYNAMMKFW